MTDLLRFLAQDRLSYKDDLPNGHWPFTVL